MFYKKNDYFYKTLYLKCLTWFWIYFWITLFVLPWFWEGYSGLLIICQTDYSIYFKLGIFPWFRSHTWKYNIQANKRLTMHCVKSVQIRSYFWSIYIVNLCIQSEQRKIRTRNNSVFGHFSRSERLKKNDHYSIWCFWSFFHFLFIPDNKSYKQKWGILFFTRIKLVARVLACACAIERIKWKRLQDS